MNSYEGGLAEQSVTHFYAGADTTPKRQEVGKKSTKGGTKVACKKKSGKGKK